MRSKGLAVAVAVVLSACGGDGGTAARGWAVLSMNDGTSGWEPYAYRDGVLTRLADAYPGTSSSLPSGFRRLGDRAVFCAGSPSGARAPWVTDGTPEGTHAVTTVAGSGCREVAVVGDRAFFGWDDGTGAEPWVTDGTAAGTFRLGDLAPGSAGSEPSGFTACGARVCFSAYDPDHGRELWGTDGTAAGTARIADLEPGSTGASPQALVAAGSLAFFTATTSASGTEPWISDGTAAGTRLLLELAPGPTGSAPRELVEAGGRAWFSADDGVSGRELWRSDGTAAGTAMVKDLWPGNASGDPHLLVRFGERLAFVGRNEDDGYQLWTSDGTEAGTTIARVISLGGSRISNLAAHGGRLWFSEDDYLHGPELYASDGTAAGTQLVADAVPGENGVSPIPLELLAAEGRVALVGTIRELLFAGDDGTHGLELWRSDGTSAGTRMVADHWAGTAPGILVTDL